MEREREKKMKYQELAADLARQLLGYKIRVVPAGGPWRPGSGGRPQTAPRGEPTLC